METTFDPFGRATEQNRSGSYTQIVYSPSGAKFAFMNGTTVLGFKAPMAAGMAAVRASDGTGYFQHADWLGSSRFAHDGGGNVKYDRAYAPFGEVYFADLLGFTTNRDFTGQTEDTTLGLYDFPFRQQSQSQGGWLVPDPAGLAAVDLTNPQTWNRYAYVANNPLNAIDPLGLMMDEVCWFGDCGGGGGPYTPDGYCPPEYEYCGDPPPIPCLGCGGRGEPPEPPSPSPQPPPQPIHFPNETLGIPNGLNVNFGGVWGAIIPSGNCADLGPCPTIGNSIVGVDDAAEVAALIYLYGLTIYAVEKYGPPLIQLIKNKLDQTSEDARCSKVQEECADKCWEDVQTKLVLPQDKPGLLRKCTRRCMNEHGCFDF